MANDLTTIARDSTLRILEGAAFLFTDLLEPESTPGRKEHWAQLGVRLDWTGPVKGEMRLWINDALAKVIAINMLGLEDGVPCPREREIDAVKEVLNMVVGNFLTEAFGTEAVFHLGIPQTLLSASIVESLDAQDRFWVSAEEQPILVSVHPLD